MEPLTGALTFSTIVGLLINFKGERSGRDMDQFVQWLKEKHHHDVADHIEHNKTLFTEITKLLSTNHDELIQKLDGLDQILSSVAARIEGFSGIVTAVYPGEKISDQAISILTQLVLSGAKYFTHLHEMTGEPDKYHLFEGAQGEIEYDEPRFMEDDLLTLISFGLIRHEPANNGNGKFYVTREAVKYINSLC